MSDLRRGKNTRHLLTGLLRQSVFGRLAGYEDVNDAERLSRDPAMRAIVDRKGLERSAASTSQMWRFETEWLATKENRVVLADLSGVWIDRVRLSASRRSIKVGAQPSNGSRKAKSPSTGHAYLATVSATTRSGSSSMRSPIISATSCAPWRCRRRSNTGR